MLLFHAYLDLLAGVTVRRPSCWSTG